MTAPYLGDDTPRWQGYTHDEILAMVAAGPGRGAAQFAEGRWHATWFSLTMIDAQLARAIADIGSGWEGQGATATTAAVTPLGLWATEGAEQSLSTSKSLESQAGYAEYTRNAMPPNPHPGLIQNPSTGTPSDMLATWAAEDQARDNAAARAQELMQSYTYNSFDTVPGMLESVPPPTVSIATVAGGGSGGGGVGALPVTSAAELGAGSPTASAAAGGSGATGAGGAITSALNGTPGPGAAGPGAAGSGPTGSGAAGTGAGAGAAGIGAGVPAGAGAAVGAGAGAAAGAGGAAAAGTGGPAGAGTGPVGGRGAGPVGGATGGAGGRVGGGTAGVPGVPATAGGPGRGATPSSSRSPEPGASRAATGSISGRPGSAGLGEPVRPGNRWPVPESPPRGPSASWPPIGSSPGAGGSERAGSDRLGSAAPPARPSDPLPPPGRADRGTPFPSSAPPAGGTPGRQSPGHAPMMPMGGGAGGTQGETRRRPPYLVDDGSAFADDRVIGSHIINEDPEDHRG